MIIGIEGAIGSGKTIQMVRLLKKDSEAGNDTLTNFKTTFSKPLNVLDILEKNKTHENINNVSVGIDEITVFMDCRRSSSKMNLLLSYFVLQTRKKNVQLYYTTQDLNMIDIRLFKHTDVVVFCDFIYNDEDVLVDNWRKYTIIDFRDRRKPKIVKYKLKISPYYDLYDTKEVIMPPI